GGILLGVDAVHGADIDAAGVLGADALGGDDAGHAGAFAAGTLVGLLNGWRFWPGASGGAFRTAICGAPFAVLLPTWVQAAGWLLVVAVAVLAYETMRAV